MRRGFVPLEVDALALLTLASDQASVGRDEKERSNIRDPVDERKPRFSWTVFRNTLHPFTFGTRLGTREGCFCIKYLKRENTSRCVYYGWEYFYRFES